MDLREKLISLREETGMKRTEFARYFEIPYRTLQDWERGKRRIPAYLYRLMKYKIRVEAFLKEKQIVVEGLEDETDDDYSEEA